MNVVKSQNARLVDNHSWTEVTTIGVASIAEKSAAGTFAVAQLHRGDRGTTVATGDHSNTSANTARPY